MRKIFGFIIGLIVCLASENAFSQNPYADGTTLPDGTTTGSPWSVASGEVVSAEGELFSGGAGTISGTMNVAGDFHGRTLDVYGTLTIQGNYVENDWSGLTIYNGGVVEVFGDFLNSNRNIEVQAGGTLIVHQLLDQNNTMTIDGTVEVYGDFDSANTLTVGSTGVLIVHQVFDQNNTVTINGTVEVYGNFDSSNTLTVGSSGVVIAHSNFTQGNTLNLDGNIVVAGSMTASGAVDIASSTGNLVVGEDLVTGNHVSIDGNNSADITSNVYVINGDASGQSWSSVGTNGDGVGDIDDYLANESGNTTLNDIVSSIGIIPNPKTYYTLASGDWNDEDIWTLDPAGAVSIEKAVPSAGDHVVILTGRTVTVPDGNDPYDGDPKPSANLSLDLGSVTIYGNLDLRKSSGHQFQVLKGNGRLLMAGDNYPNISNDSKFVDAGEDGGTCVYYGASNFNIQSASTFYNLEIDMNAGNSVTLSENYQINGNLLIKRGAARLGENSSIRYTMTVLGDITVNSGAELTTISGNSFGDNENDYHQIICSGNFINNGVVKLTTQGAPDYDTRLTGNGVSAVVLTMNGTSDINFTCNGQTDLYRLIIDKGTDQTYTVNLSASSQENFRLFGCNNQNGADTKALVFKNGTLKLSGDIFIPTLTEGGSDFIIPTTTQLWLNGAGVTVNSTARSNAETQVGSVTGTGVDASNTGSQSFSVKGKFRVTKGKFDTKSHGFVAWDDGNAIVQIEGGTVITPGLRSAGSQNGKWSYIQSGGLVQLYGDLQSDLYGSGSPTFHIKSSNNAFYMSGGEIEIFDAATSSNLAIGIESGEGNYSVTGGTIKINRNGGGSDDFNISSTAPFYNLEILGTNNTEAILNTDLTVLNDLTINTNTELNASGHTLEIGGDFTNNATYTTGTNITRFIGSNASVVNGGTINFNTLELAKEDVSQSVSLGTGTISMSGDLIISKGNFNINQRDVSLRGDINISYGNITGVYALNLNGNQRQTLKGRVGQNSNFGNLKLNNTGSSPQIKLLSNVYVNTVTFSRNQVFDIGAYNLEILSSVYTDDGSWGTNRMFATDGLASNRGLTLPIDLIGGYGTGQTIQFFPMGFLDPGDNDRAYFREVYVDARNNPVDNGKITVSFNNDNHPTVDDPSQVENFYWRVELDGFSLDNSSNLRYVFSQDKQLSETGSRRGMIFQNDNTWLGGNATLTNNRRNIAFDFGSPLEKEYSWGQQNGFNAVKTLYSKRSGRFSDASTWTENPDHTTGNNVTPRSYYMYVIGGAGTENHTVYIDNGADASQVYIKGKSETHIGENDNSVDPPTLEMRTSAEGPLTTNFLGYINGGNDLSFIRGKGRFLIYDSADMPTVDFSDFIKNDEAIFEYSGNGDYTLPTYTYALWLGLLEIPIADIATYPNLHITGSGTKTAGDIDLYVYGDIYAEQANFNISPSNSGDIIVENDLIVNTGHVILPNGQTRSLEINGDINFTGNGSFNIANGGSFREHQIDLYGNVYQNSGSLDFANTANAILSFIGNESVNVETGGATDFYRIDIDKPSDQTVYFSDAFTLSGDASQAIKPINMISGIGRFQNSGTQIISSGGYDFRIPSGSTLQIDNGTTFNITGNDKGIWLDGSLILDKTVAGAVSGGILNCNGGTNNYIEYSTSGDASILLQDNTQLNIGSQLRRSLNTDVGILTFNQNSASSSVTVGNTDDGDNIRGVFEILGTGSSFTQVAGANITISDGHGANNIGLYFEPETVSIGSGAGFTITSPSNVVAIYAGSELEDLTIDGQAQLSITPLTMNGDLTISSGILNANSLDLTLRGDFTNSVGTAGYVAGVNTTYFDGIEDQIITGATTFDHVVKSGSGSLSQAGTTSYITTNDLTLSSGTLVTGENDLTVLGDLVNNIIISSSGASEGIVMSSADDIQQLRGSGTFARLTINNANGVNVPTQSGSINFSDYLKLQDGVFDIGRNLLVFGENATIEHNGANFSNANMIQTNLSFVDNGIKKVFPQITKGSDPVYTFVYPIGSSGKYTPVTAQVANNGNNTGAIRVKAADEAHVSILDRSETSFDDTKNVLQYNWTLDADGIDNFEADIVMQGDASDVLVTDGNSASDYLTARILLSEIQWSKYDKDDFNEGTTELTFNFSGVDDDEIDGDYTAGYAGNDNTTDVDDAIPDEIASYISVVEGGDWNSGSTWKPYNPVTRVTDMAGSGPDGGPKGSLAFVNTNVIMPQNFMAAYRTHISASGTITTNTTFGHRLGAVSGTGLINVGSGNLPSGTYDEFFSVNGGTLEYSGNSNYDILSEITQVNNLKLTGTGSDIRRLPNIESGVHILGDLLIENVYVDNTHNRDLYVSGDVIINSSSFEAGTTVGDRQPTMIFNGNSLQEISGNVDFTSIGAGAFYNFEINNPSGVTVSNNIEIENVLKLSDGVIFADAGGSVTVTNALASAVSGGTNDSYVQGPLSKVITDGDNFTFPVGDKNRYMPIDIDTDGADTGGELWTVQFYSHNPTVDGYDVDQTTLGADGYVSHGEYWRAKGPASKTAKITLNWDNLSGVNPNDVDFRLVEWTDYAPLSDPTSDKWSELEVSNPLGDVNSGSVQTSAFIDFNKFSAGNYFTFGSISTPEFMWEGDDLTSPTDWFIAANWSNNVIPSASSDVTIATSNPAIINGTVTVYSLRVAGGSSLTLNAGSQLTVMGDLKIEDDLNTATQEFVVNNTVANPASIIVYGTSTGNTTYVWKGLTNMYWWHIGLPVYNVNNAEFDASYLGTANYALNRYAISTWERVAGVNEVYADYNFNSDLLEGYSLLPRYYQDLSYEGVLNNSDYSHTYSTAQWYLIANPYPSYIDVDDSGFDMGNFLKTVYIESYDNITSTYNTLTKVGVNRGSRYIAPGQAVWLRTYQSGDAISIHSSTRVHATGNLKSSQVEDNNILRFSVSSKNNTDEAVVLLNEDFGSENVTMYDSEKLKNGGNKVNVYSIKGNKDISINALPELTGERVIPLGYSVASDGMSEFTFRATNIANFKQDVDVYLVDKGKEESVTVNLRETPIYKFTPSTTASNNRFELKFVPSVTTDIDADNYVSESSVLIYTVKTDAIIKVTEDILNQKDRSIEVYDVSGHLVKQVELNNIESTVSLPHSNSIYIINVVSGDHSYQQKVISQN